MFVDKEPAGPSGHQPGGSAGGIWRCKQVRSRRDMIRVIDAVAATMTAAGYPPRDVFSMRLALEEAIGNAWEQGASDDNLKQVRVSYQVTTEQTLAEVADEGPGFEASQVSVPTVSANLEWSRRRSLLLMRAHLSWVRPNDGGNGITLCKCRSAA
jgi:serine/threonine-protein kinase RsbW